ncbi:MAG: hypothetical protein R6U86_09560 [Bacteroidales bacterium]
MKIKNATLLVLLTLLLASPLASSGQDTPAGVDYSNVRLFGAGISLGSYGYGWAGSRSISFPPVSAYFEMGIHEYITVGPFLGFNRWNYRYTNWNYSWTFIHGGLRGSFHYTSILNELLDGDIDESKLDLYITLMAGLQLRNYSSSSSGFGDHYDNQIRLFLGPVAGIRYYFTDNLAVFAEGGYGSLGALSFGLSVRF